MVFKINTTLTLKFTSVMLMGTTLIDQAEAVLRVNCYQLSEALCKIILLLFPFLCLSLLNTPPHKHTYTVCPQA